MSLLDKIKSMFSGGSSADTGDHSAHDHSGDDHSHDDEQGHTHEPAVSPPDPAEGDSTP
ncbi:MAG: hypothetical protein QOF45_1897 [Gaiellaceae bacterium]|jgi:hypothetical protein|nr:hypothetical protein [Gaiellaceae bacterium]